MKIEVVKLKNIQGHVDSELTFHEGVNVIKGRSHGGKTTIVRGIEWVAKNRPQGKSILRRKTGKEGSSFTITTDDKINITRHRSNTANGYLIKKEGVKKPKNLDALRADVPDDIKQILNLTEINVQTQHDRLFLLQNTSPGEVAKRLNEIVGLQIIDEVTGIIKSFATKAKENIGKAEAGVSDAKNQLEEFKDLDDREADLMEVVSLKEEVEEENSKLESLIDLDAQLDELEQSIKDTKEWLGIEQEYEELKQLAEEVEEIQTELESLEDYDEQIEECERNIKIAKKKKEKNETLLEEKFRELKICPLCERKIK